MDLTTAIKRKRSLLFVTSMVWAVVALSNTASAQEVSPPTASLSREAVPACAPSLRLRAVQYDPKREERSFALFSGYSQRAQPLRRGARVAGYAIERIEQGRVLLSTASQRCAVALRGATVERALRAVSVDEVRAALRSRSRAVVSTASAPRPTVHIGS